MGERTLKDEARLYYVPYILGNTPEAHRLSRSIYHKFGIISVICDSRRSFFDVFDLTSRTVTLSSTDSSRLIAEQLVSLAAQTRYTLPLIIPASDELRKVVSDERGTLERSFVICEADTLFNSSPLADILR
ncbi:MAG: hypothetical protein E7642_01045 [Ruminococcaceae bacterium]|nr:hypothetical protein [Oscillospiraceae bacterium]